MSVSDLENAQRNVNRVENQWYLFAVTEAQFFIEQRDRGVQIRSELNRGDSRRIGSLQCMPALHAAPATPADTRLNVELPVDDGPRDFGLVLDERFGPQRCVAAAIGAAGPQRHVIGFISLGHRPTMVLAVVVTQGECVILGNLA